MAAIVLLLKVDEPDLQVSVREGHSQRVSDFLVWGVFFHELAQAQNQGCEEDVENRDTRDGLKHVGHAALTNDQTSFPYLPNFSKFEFSNMSMETMTPVLQPIILLVCAVDLTGVRARGSKMARF